MAVDLTARQAALKCFGDNEMAAIDFKGDDPYPLIGVAH